MFSIGLVSNPARFVYVPIDLSQPGAGLGGLPAMAKQITQMSSRRLVLLIKFRVLIFKISGVYEGSHGQLTSSCLIAWS